MASRLPSARLRTTVMLPFGNGPARLSWLSPVSLADFDFWDSAPMLLFGNAMLTVGNTVDPVRMG